MCCRRSLGETQAWAFEEIIGALYQDSDRISLDMSGVLGTEHLLH